MRRFWLWVHRWVGLLMAGPLVLVALTGSLLAFNTDLERLLGPQLFASPPATGADVLPLATLAERAEAAQPRIRVAYFELRPGQAFVHVVPRQDPASGKPFAVDFDQMFLDPWTGRELGHRRWADLSQGRVNLMPFVYDLHQALALGTVGTWILGIVALAWTLDCVYSIYLTLPLVRARFLARWAKAWRVKWPSSSFRLNVDLHRAQGLWLAPMLFVFAWSSVMFLDVVGVYERATAALFDYEGLESMMKTRVPSHPSESPRLSWQQAEARGQRLVAEVAQREGIGLGRPTGMAYIADPGVYTYDVDSDRSVSEGGWSGVGVWVDGETGALQRVFLPDGQHTGNTVGTWLRALHFANLHGWLAYRIFVAVLGVAVAALSVTGVTIWLVKRRARLALAGLRAPAAGSGA